MRRRGERAPREKVAVAAAEEEMKSAGRKAEQGAEEYQCTGLLEQDFPELCARAGIAAVPKVTPRPSPSFPEDEEPPEPTLAEVLAGIERKYSYFQPCVQAEREHEDPRSVAAVFLRGWKIEEDMLGVLSQCLPALAGLQALHLWKVGLTERLLPALVALLARCPRLRTLSLEGNPLPEPAFHTLMGSDSTLAHLSLRNNSIGDAAARLIGQSLSTPSSSNRSLVSLVLSFNRISDLGAGYIAEGLRLNRSLLSLSLASNDIGDAGAIKLAEVLGPFALTHAEVVERRRLLLAEALGRSRTTSKETESQSEQFSSRRSSMTNDKLPPAKSGKPPSKKKEPARKEEARQPKKAPEPRGARGREAKLSSQEKLSPEAPDPAAPPRPLLDEARQSQGSVVLPGNRALLNLNLTYNHITERGLGAFLAALERQQQEKQPKVPGKEGLLCLSLEKNRIPPPSPAFARLQELLPPLDPLLKSQEEERESGA
ncbi:LOW QUALITY PROTEIN: leucine-rich repeat-containing protein 71 [Tyto alba]|uniref:LOW QUALITY PROTEIN: leucine-rich repeat-containing protein 71 n=1 Tax=Tyto alba TaxID=56313 RepID=UPI001C673F50|nr:LOW QUALITY PROTEIN: leucine-rich repeat-containing protein 71 [Tyto alba]